MSRRKLRVWAFIFSEAKRFFSSIPQIILLLVSLASGAVMYRYQLLEVFRAILEGVIAGYIFYFFVDVIPKTERRAGVATKVAEELIHVLTMLDSFKEKVKAEVIASGQNPRNQNQFFYLLQNMVGTHMPSTNGMKAVKGTIPQSGSTPIQFIYSNLDEVLRSELHRLTQRLEALERASAIYGLAELDGEMMKIVSDLPVRSPFSRSIQALQHIQNTPAVYGTDFDMIEKGLLKVKTTLEGNWKINFSTTDNST